MHNLEVESGCPLNTTEVAPIWKDQAYQVSGPDPSAQASDAAHQRFVDVHMVQPNGLAAAEVVEILEEHLLGEFHEQVEPNIRRQRMVEIPVLCESDAAQAKVHRLQS